MDKNLKMRIQDLLERFSEDFTEALDEDEHDGGVLKGYEWADYAQEAMNLLMEVMEEE